MRFIESPDEIKNTDLIIIPGSRNTIGDLRRLKEKGFSKALLDYSREKPVIGICGGLQMLGVSVSDPEGVEEGGEEEGFSLLPIKSVLMKDKIKKKNLNHY